MVESFLPRLHGPYSLRGCWVVLAWLLFAALRPQSTAAHGGVELPEFPIAVASHSTVSEKSCKAESPWEDDDVWLINSRQSCAPCGAPPVLRFERLKDCCDWEPMDVEDLGGSEARGGTIFFIHGNRMTDRQARSHGLLAYRQWKRRADPSQRFRFVIWSWPSEAIRGLVHDVRTKAARTPRVSYQLAWLLGRMPAEEPVALAGFSFGARIVTGALHLMGNGRLGPYELAERAHEHHQPMRVVLMAAALHSHWLEPGQRHGKALSQIDRMLLLNNSCDRVLKRYRFLDRCSRPEALGFNGLASCHRLGADAEKIEQFDGCCILGRNHSPRSYLCSRTLMDRAWEYLRTPSAHDSAAMADVSAADVQ